MAQPRTQGTRGKRQGTHRGAQRGAGHEARLTTDIEEIRRWAGERGGHPAAVRSTMKEGRPGILRIDFDPPESSLERIDWETFAEVMEENNLGFLCQERTRDGQVSRFFKLVDRDTYSREDEPQ